MNTNINKASWSLQIAKKLLKFTDAVNASHDSRDKFKFYQICNERTDGKQANEKDRLVFVVG